MGLGQDLNFRLGSEPGSEGLGLVLGFGLQGWFEPEGHGLGFRPWDLSLEAGFWASMLGFGP